MLAERKVCILVANGFAENQVTEIQRALTKAKTSFKIVAPEQGLVNGWQGNGWGHYFTVDSQIGSTMGSDYDALIVIGGERAIAKLKTNLHTRRIINHFLEAEKPVSAIAEGVTLLALTPKAAGLTVAAPAESEAELTAAHMERSSEAQHQDRHVLTATAGQLEGWVEASMALIDAYQPEAVEQAA